MRLTILPFATAVALAMPLAGATATEGTALLKDKCAVCHAIEKPASFSLDRILERKGPDLYYAGLKYRAKWLEAWLREPKPIRPSGTFYGNAIVPGSKGDAVDVSKLPDHPKLPKDGAAAITASLMALKPPGIVEAGAYRGNPGNQRLAAMAFTKLRGCSACHRSEPDQGGLSGPELHTGGQRLQPDFIASYIKDPQKIDPYVWMPKQEMNEQDVQRLTGFIIQLTGKEAR